MSSSPPRSRSPSPQRRRLNPSDDNTCPICFDAWTTGGAHHLVCLPCGHLFGHSCIRQWLQQQRRSSCPTCKTKARVGDIRYIFGTARVCAVDNSEAENLRRELGEEKAKHAVTKERLRGLERSIKEMRKELQRGKAVQFGGNREVVTILKSFRTGGGTKAMEFCDGALLYSENFGNGQRICSMDLSGGVKVGRVRSRKCINGIGGGELILVSSMEKRVYVCTKGLMEAGRIETEGIPMSTCWLDGNVCAVGGIDGGVRFYDVRNLGNVLTRQWLKNEQGVGRAVCGMGYWEGGVLTATGHGVWKVEPESVERIGEWKGHVYGLGVGKTCWAAASVQEGVGTVCLYKKEGKVKEWSGVKQLSPMGGVGVCEGGVLVGDGDAVRIWGGGDWKEWKGGGGGIRCASGMALPKEANIMNVPQGSRGVVAGGGGGVITLYATGWW